jgi:hypothetical protein
VPPVAGVNETGPRASHAGPVVFRRGGVGVSVGGQQTQQQTGMPFMHIIIVQPGIIIEVMQSQQAWIILQAIGSMLVQVMTQPISVISTLHMPMAMLQQQHIMPFIMQQQPIMALGIIMHIC